MPRTLLLPLLPVSTTSTICTATCPLRSLPRTSPAPSDARVSSSPSSFHLPFFLPLSHHPPPHPCTALVYIKVNRAKNHSINISNQFILPSFLFTLLIINQSGRTATATSACSRSAPRTSRSARRARLTCAWVSARKRSSAMTPTLTAVPTPPPPPSPCPTTSPAVPPPRTSPTLVPLLVVSLLPSLSSSPSVPSSWSVAVALPRLPRLPPLPRPSLRTLPRTRRTP
ncbi:hypothetical protein BKA57DRAFT_455779 [Linnemannia elongata]|nr:hypothetical protein BKA57DRAFT_455779 [Linnemannia elongata]